MNATGKLDRVTSEMRRYNLHAIGITESRLTGSGKMGATLGGAILFSWREYGQDHEGLAIILKKGVEKSLMEWKSVSNRFITTRLNGKQVNIAWFDQRCCWRIESLILWQQQHKVDCTPDHDIKIIVDDMNATVWADNKLWQSNGKTVARNYEWKWRGTCRFLHHQQLCHRLNTIPSSYHT